MQPAKSPLSVQSTHHADKELLLAGNGASHATWRRTEAANDFAQTSSVCVSV